MVEHSWHKGINRAFLAVALGILLGFVFYWIANIVYHIGLRFLYSSGSQLIASNPLHWIVRAIAWSVFGSTGGIMYGIAGPSLMNSIYGVIGSIIGAALRGLAWCDLVGRGRRPMTPILYVYGSTSV